MEKRIIWRRWRDPMAPLVKRDGAEPDDDHEEVFAAASRDDVLDGEPAELRPRERRGSFGPGIVGPFGVIPLHEENLPSKLFEFWMGHCNFDLTEKVVDEIKRVPGVETLDVGTRYRFRLGVGKAFAGRQVRDAVSDAACGRSALAALKALMGATHPFWSVYVMPGGRLEAAAGETAEEAAGKGRRFEKAANEVFRSW